MSDYEFSDTWEDEGIRGGAVPEGDFGDPELADGAEYAAPDAGRFANANNAPDELALVEMYTGSSAPGRAPEYEGLLTSPEEEAALQQTPAEAYRETVEQAGFEYEAANDRALGEIYGAAAQAANLETDAVYERAQQEIQQEYWRAIANSATHEELRQEFEDPDGFMNVQRAAAARAAHVLSNERITANALRMSGLNR